MSKLVLDYIRPNTEYTDNTWLGINVCTDKILSAQNVVALYSTFVPGHKQSTCKPWLERLSSQDCSLSHSQYHRVLTNFTLSQLTQHEKFHKSTSLTTMPKSYFPCNFLKVSRQLRFLTLESNSSKSDPCQAQRGFGFILYLLAEIGRNSTRVLEICTVNTLNFPKR